MLPMANLRRALDEQLRRVQSVTDAALAHLTLERLLDELLRRVRELLQVDTAAVLLLDEERRELVATAAIGIEKEVEEGVRLPLGEGFAGKIAATGLPVFLPVVEHGRVLNPLLLERGIRSMLGVPLIVNGHTIGVLHVGSLTPRMFTDADTQLLQLVADRTALAVHARRAESHQMIAETLQHSLLPERLPLVPGVEIATRYAPAGGGMVGGDWYDVFTLPHETLGLVVGDIAGRGLDAAVLMTRLRNVVRALSLREDSPAKVLQALNDHVLYFDPGAIATVLYGILHPDRTLRWASAGHMPPLMIDPAGSATIVDLPSDPPIGATRDQRYTERELRLDAGWRLLLYTDGLVERRGRSLDEGLARLQTAAMRPDWTTLEDLCTLLDARRESLADDLAILSIRIERRAGEDLNETIAADPRELSRLRRSLRAWLDDLGVSGQDAHDVLVATSEAVSNSVEHAYGPGRGRVRVSGRAKAGMLEIAVSDQGRWREPRGYGRGRGRLFMSAMMDDVTLESSDEGTIVVLRKAFEGEHGDGG